MEVIFVYLTTGVDVKMDRDNYRKYNNSSAGKDVAKTRSTGNEWEQLSYKLGNDTKKYEDEDDFFQEVNSSLARQIRREMGENSTSTRTVPTSTRAVTRKKKGLPKGLKIFAVVFSIIMLMCGFLMFTSPGRKVLLNIAGKYIYKYFDYEPGEDMDQVKGGEDIDKEKDIPKPKKEVVNILLLGVEEIGGASNTDVMIIASMNTKNNTMKLTSLMRDLYVEIDGFDNNRLNSVYAKGGISLLYDTIHDNFGVELDGYALVNFNSFEQIVDILGGVEITLTNNEAHYLNTTNYISNPSYRNVVAGTQTVNGNQAVGYCRVRKVSTGTENNDFGRTQRHRAVLNAIFDKMKSKNILKMVQIMNELLTEVDIKTDIKQAEFNSYLEEAISLNVKKLENLRIPSDGNYEGVSIRIGKYKQSVLQPTDWDATREEIRQFIYEDKTTVSDTTAEKSTTVE